MLWKFRRSLEVGRWHLSPARLPAMASRTSTATTTRDLAFIITTSHATPDEQSRKLIRSHVMQGKNKGKTYRARRPGTSGQRSTRRTKPPAQQVESQKDSDPGVLTRPRADAIPKKVGSDLSFFQVADESIETPTLLNLFKCKPARPSEVDQPTIIMLPTHLSTLVPSGPHPHAAPRGFRTSLTD